MARKPTKGFWKGCIPLTPQKTKKRKKENSNQWEKDICLGCDKPESECKGNCILKKEMIKNDKF